ncbi:MAG: hypothetical protein NZL93_02970, partial [Chthoniobacterales bacterium]|nr:hypothetical protein [Chthoniobacterales bacterium]
MPPPFTLILTWTLQPQTKENLALSDPFQRTIAHLEGLLAWLQEEDISHILILKNCSAKIQQESFSKLAAEYNKEIHLFQCSPSNKVKFYGKGYGEGEMLAQAIEKVQLLSSRPFILKCTGKLFSPSWKSLLHNSTSFWITPNPNQKNGLLPYKAFRLPFVYCSLDILRRRLHIPWNFVACIPPEIIDTRMYWCSLSFYKKNLLRSYFMVRESLGLNLEVAFYFHLIQIKNLNFLKSEPV